MKKRTKMCLILQYDDGLVYRLYGSSTAFRYDFPDVDYDYIRFELKDKPYVLLNVSDDRVENPPQILKLSKRMVY